MTKIVFLILTMLLGATDWEMASQKPNYKLYYSEGLKTSKWLGHPDSDYSWDGERLSYERIVKDENGKEVLVKTYKDPIEIIADFKPASKVFGVEGKIEEAAVRKFGGALKGFVWLDKVSGGGEVVLPFTAKHIFIATGDRLNPELTEIFTDPTSDNYYEVIEGKTRVFVKSFSGIGGAAGKPPELIAHYKFNENTSGDNAELVTNGNFATDTDWDKGTGWSIAAGVAHCDGSQGGSTNLRQRIAVVETGKKYRVQFTISNYSAGSVRSGLGGYENGAWRSGNGTYVDFIVPVNPSQNGWPYIIANADFIGDIDDVSVKLCAVEDSSGNDHDGLAQRQTSDLNVVGKINGAFDFTPNDFIEIADHADFTPALTPFSISIWVNMHSSSSFNIAGKGLYNISGEWRFYTLGAGTSLRLLFFDESIDNCRIGRGTGDISAYENAWIHLVGTFDGGKLSSGIKIYLNGVRIDNVTVETNAGSFDAIENLAAPVHIGRYDAIYADGLIDDVIFFSLEVTPDEVKRLFNNGHGTEILAEVDSVISPRRSNASPLGTRARYEW